MTAAAAEIAPPGPMPRIALVGNPNCGKTALFNLLTGARQKVANYAGVTVERKEGLAHLPDGRTVRIVDLPGTYSLVPATLDEQVTLDVIDGRRTDEAAPDLILAVVDATNLRMSLRLVLELAERGRPMMVALNMADEAAAQGLEIDVARLAGRLGCPVVPTVAVRADGHAALLAGLRDRVDPDVGCTAAAATPPATRAGAAATPEARLAQVRDILRDAAPGALASRRFHPGLDRWTMHPVWGLVILALLLFVVFQAVFAWAQLPMDAIKAGMNATGDWARAAMPDGPLRSLVVDGVIAGVGSVLVFLPQILLLFAFILVLEDSGYLPRAAFLLDTLMGRAGLSGRAFIPLLSSFACAVPGVMATRTIANDRDRLTTILVAPLMTCSARLPVYALLIGAFVPARAVGPFNLRGLTLFALYAAGVVSALGVSWVLRRVWHRSGYQPLMLELPPYRWPNMRNLLLGLWERARGFLQRVGTIIFSLTVVLWALATWPAPPVGAAGPAIVHSWAGQLGHLLLPLVEPLGFNWQIAVALVPGMAAREVAVGALGTVYALSAGDGQVADALGPILQEAWPLATAYALLAWYVFAPQCISTLAMVRRETRSWRVVFGMLGYLFALAWVAAFITYRVARALGG